MAETDRSFAVAIEIVANWTPLENRLSPKLCAEFMWMYRENGVEHYKHIVTRHYLRRARMGDVWCERKAP